MNKGRKGKAGGKPIYDESLKIAVARAYINGKLSHSQIAQSYNLPNGPVVRNFVRWYHQNFDPDIPYHTSSPQTELRSNKTDEQIKSRLKQVEKELSAANLKISGLEIMISIAEKEMGVEIRKKLGTKQ